MKIIQFLTVTCIASLYITGCGGDSSTTQNTTKESSTNTRMQRDLPYEVNKGDQIEKISQNPELKIESNLQSGKTTVTLINGEAALIKEQ